MSYVTFYSKRPKAAKLINKYKIWATFEYIEDFLQISQSPSKKQAKDFAFEFIKKRYIESDNNVPDEYGAFCSNIGKEKLVKNSGELLSYFEEFKSSTQRNDTPQE